MRIARRSLGLAAAVPLVAGAALAVALAAGRGDAAKPSPGVIEGTVTSGRAHREAGVWVIAETNGLGTPYRKIVVTDGRGRFLLPELPGARYRVWVRGYGLRDSAKVDATPGDTVRLRVATATRRQAARVYPASYWLSMLRPPDGSASFVSSFKLGCELCHQIGASVTRGLTREGYDAGLRKATSMNSTAESLGRERLLDALADWGLRVRRGETPPRPPRPRGVERNVVITQWEWGNTFSYAHDEVATDKRNPRVNANGPIYGVDLANDHVLTLDPVRNRAGQVKVPTLNGYSTPWCDETYVPAAGGGPFPAGFGTLGCPAPGGASAFVGKYDNPANPHNPMMDAQGRVWITTQVRREWDQDLPAFCQGGPAMLNHPHHRQLGYYDPKTRRVQLIDTCYGTHHLQFDTQGRLWLSGDSFVLGWFDPARYDPARPETLQQAQGFAEMKVDTDGDGVGDTPSPSFNYGVIANHKDGSVWTGRLGPGRGSIMRFNPGTGQFEVYQPPAPGSGPRGVDVDSNGIVWTALGGSGHLARFDRSRCRQTWGRGDQCPEGWTLWRAPGPTMQTQAGAQNEAAADFQYYIWVDQHNTLGMGRDMVVMNGTGSDSLTLFNPRTQRFSVIRIPYPLNSYTRGLDGRIDNPRTGWKGRALWFTNGLDPLIHSEVARSYVGKVQMRPSPLAR